jgi:hypothetical protein
MVFVVAIIRELRGRVWRALGLSLTRRLETCLTSSPSTTVSGPRTRAAEEAQRARERG